jgi:hypothetical protein
MRRIKFPSSIDEVRMACEGGTRSVGNTCVAPPSGSGNAGPDIVPIDGPIGPQKALHGSPVVCVVSSSAVVAMVVGIRPGATNLTLSEFVCMTLADPVRGAGAGRTAMSLPLIGVDIVRAAGSPTVLSRGKRSSIPIITACSPNEVIVVQLRRVRCAQEVSSMLSANMLSVNIEPSSVASLNMASSSVKSCCWYGHRKPTRGRRMCKKKGRARARPAGILVELSRHRRCPVITV